MSTRNLEDARLNATRVQDVVLDSHTGEVLDILPREVHLDTPDDIFKSAEVGQQIESGAYVAIPIETLDNIVFLIDSARAYLYVGRTQDAMKSIETARLEVTRDE